MLSLLIRFLDVLDGAGGFFLHSRVRVELPPDRAGSPRLTLGRSWYTVTMSLHDWSRVDAGVFHHFHFFWIAQLTEMLTDGLLPEGFDAMVERVQDLGPSYWARTRHILILHTLRQDRVVAVVELVSPGNKDANVRANQYVDKSVAYLARGIHVLCVDVHPPTGIVPAGFHALISSTLGHEPVALPPGRDRMVVSYQVLADGHPRAHIAPLRVGDALPEMPVFLFPDRFVRAPLELAYNEAWKRLAKRFRDVLEA
jgi:hypothetical protein